MIKIFFRHTMNDIKKRLPGIKSNIRNKHTSFNENQNKMKYIRI